MLSGINFRKSYVFAFFSFGCLWKGVDDFKVYARLEDYFVVFAPLLASCLAKLCPCRERLLLYTIEVWRFQPDG